MENLAREGTRVPRPKFYSIRLRNALIGWFLNAWPQTCAPRSPQGFWTQMCRRFALRFCRSRARQG